MTIEPRWDRVDSCGNVPVAQIKTQADWEAATRFIFGAVKDGARFDAFARTSLLHTFAVSKTVNDEMWAFGISVAPNVAAELGIFDPFHGIKRRPEQ